MAIRPFLETVPRVAATAYVDEAAVVIGDVELAEDSSLWPMAVARGDVNSIRIGPRSNIQDGTVLHVTHDHAGAAGGHPVAIAEEVTVGHNATLHGCRIGPRCLIGMGAVVLDGAVLGPELLLAAGSLVPPGKSLEGGYLYLGHPARRVRPLSDDERHHLAYSARHYVGLKDRYLAGGPGQG